MNSYVWVAVFSVLGTIPEHGKFGAFDTRELCVQALEMRKLEYLKQQKELVGTCVFASRSKV